MQRENGGYKKKINGNLNEILTVSMKMAKQMKKHKQLSKFL